MMYVGSKYFVYFLTGVDIRRTSVHPWGIILRISHMGGSSQLEKINKKKNKGREKDTHADF